MKQSVLVLTALMSLVASLPAQALGPVGDYDGDGHSDVIWRELSSGINIISLSADGNAERYLPTAYFEWLVVGRGDFDGDGRADVLWRHSRTGANAIWKSANRTTTQAVGRVPDFNWKVAGIGDFDGDGRSDVLWRNSSTGANGIWKSAKNATPQVVRRVPDINWKIVGIGDFDADGKADVFWRNIQTGANAIWKSANYATQQAVTSVTKPYWRVVGIGDFDGDGRSDVLWRNIRTGANAIWKSANYTTQQAVTGVANLDWKVADIGDFDGDGRSDVLWRRSDAVTVLWKSANSSTWQRSWAHGRWYQAVPYEFQPQVEGAPRLVIDSASAYENGENGGIFFWVYLTQPADAPVRYDIATADIPNSARGVTYGSNIYRADYYSLAFTGELMPAGMVIGPRGDFGVEIINDRIPETTESFNVNLSNVHGAELGIGQATGTIIDDD